MPLRWLQRVDHISGLNTTTFDVVILLSLAIKPTQEENSNTSSQTAAASLLPTLANYQFPGYLRCDKKPSSR